MIRLPEESSHSETTWDELSAALVGYDIESENSAAPEELGAELLQLTEAFFAPGGPLSTADFGVRSYEERPQQTAMAKAIAQALIAGRNLCVEAPTGIGKSFAYLVPLFYRAKQCALPAIISTGTINLQEQLLDRDLPLLTELTGLDIKCALAKGRHNYLCLRRLEMVSGEERDALLPTPGLSVDLEYLQRRLANGFSGDTDDLDRALDPQLWNLVCCEAGNCLGPKCPHYRQCYYYQARRRWDDADIVIANHALFFTDLALRGEGGESPLLPNYGAVLLDEAHTLEDAAANHLGLHLSKFGLIGTLNRLYNPDNAKGLLMHGGSRQIVLRSMVQDARDETKVFFAQYENFLAEKGESAAAIAFPERFSDRLSAQLFALAAALDEESEEETEESRHTELTALKNRVREYGDGIVAFHSQNMPRTVYYAERDRNQLVLHGAPLNVGELLQQALFRQDFPVMLCSATLTVRDKFDYYFGRVGFCDGEGLRLDSPFSPDQAKIYVPSQFPDPGSREFVPALAERLTHYIELTDGKAFVLFTSYQAMRYCADALRGTFAERNWRLLVQGEDGRRDQILRIFREDINSVLFGTDSFWTGVDVPGEALSNVIVTKLPFAVPSHPLIAARMKEIEQTGKSSFAEYSLPEAVLKFRQGVGRLIRSREDRGIVVILDRRVISRGYGSLFLKTLPYRVIVD